ncbi:molybdopterin molybdotransferase MoeA [Candidatus Persebacteraceae bacterium Df01]|jgi:molybdopterin molybdotransferase|uniref:Molybdopterin molybdenumtransferase n=1 Tax=Candidatus Doriopsillibacter californiensis TaxID=2970740 RepID=A0ABT7QMJ5_9GAMM|nr:molybdopterin molybdotransferase MoeA [Candidatus Persebacteraceae bacterium Df01]
MNQWTPVAEARRLILSRIKPINGESWVPLRDALGCVLSRDIVAPFNVPGHDNSAMDGFACRAADLSAEKDTALRVVGDSFAGHPCTQSVDSGQCVKIMTGAQIPIGADIVIPQEETHTGDAGEIIIVSSERKVGTHVRAAGEDLRRGDAALSAGQLCHPAEIGLMASLGIVEVPVKRKLRVAFFSTGDELKSLGDTLIEGEVYDSNRHTLAAMLQQLGIKATDLGVVADEAAALAETLDAAAAHHDVIITSGGASVGEADFIRPVLAERGEVLFWKVAMRPGRPLAYGKVGNADFFGLPGNPVSVMVCFYQFVRAALWKRAGRIGDGMLPTIPAITLAPLKKAPGRTEFQRGIMSPKQDGNWTVRSTGDQGSGILSSMTQANCFIVLEDSRGAVTTGETVQIQPFEGLVG